ncbi:MAG: carboxymuconolactone decarboxylase family protein [Methanomicrobiales archaeon]|jgi:AhpD family alkylhydroperoxidase|nr:carboxymuconolactone decarboxylase family protein [Methanomicrobiales archaeon]
MKPTKNGFERILEEIVEKGTKETGKEWMDAIQDDYGRVPLIFERMAERPDVLISHLLYKNSVTRTSSLEPKYVELISLAVGAALQCTHCTDYHIRAARRMGATRNEILQAILIAGLTAQSTVLADAYRTFDNAECAACDSVCMNVCPNTEK